MSISFIEIIKSYICGCNKNEVQISIEEKISFLLKHGAFRQISKDGPEFNPWSMVWVSSDRNHTFTTSRSTLEKAVDYLYERAKRAIKDDGEIKVFCANHNIKIDKTI